MQITNGPANLPFPPAYQRPQSYLQQQRPPPSDYPRLSDYHPKRVINGQPRYGNSYENGGYEINTPQQNNQQSVQNQPNQPPPNPNNLPVPFDPSPAESHTYQVIEKSAEDLTYQKDFNIYYDNSDFETTAYLVEPVKQHIAKLSQCTKCHQIFLSKNKLYQHLGTRGRIKSTYPDNPIIFVVSEANPVIEAIELTYQKYSQIIIDAQLTRGGQILHVCADTAAGVILINRTLVPKNILIYKMAKPLLVRGIEADVHHIDEYIQCPIYFPGKQNRKPVVASTTIQKLHIVTGLRAGMIIEIDVLTPEGINVLLTEQVVWISSCQVEVPIDVYNKESLSISAQVFSIQPITFRFYKPSRPYKPSRRLMAIKEFINWRKPLATKPC